MGWGQKVGIIVLVYFFLMKVFIFGLVSVVESFFRVLLFLLFGCVIRQFIQGELWFFRISVFLVGLSLVFSVQLVLIRFRLIWFSMCGNRVDLSFLNFRFFGFLVMFLGVVRVLFGFFNLSRLVFCNSSRVCLLLLFLLGMVMVVLLGSLVSDLYFFE